MQLASIPSPSQGVWHLGPLPLRAYAMMIIIGVIVAVWLGERRWIAKGGQPGVVIDVAVWAVPFGLIGGRLYHVITDYQMYFGEGKQPLDALKVWHGGLGIWGAVAVGALGAWIGCRSKGVRLAPFADAVAPGIALAQGIGRWGNWWNQELYGKPTTLPWAVEIDRAHRPKDSLGGILPQYENVGTYHPTFLYESLWCVALAVVVIWAGKRFELNHGRTFALYVAGYTVGRGWIEALRIDEAHEFLGLRLNDYTAMVVFLGAVAYMYVNRTKAGLPDPLYDDETVAAEALVPAGVAVGAEGGVLDKPVAAAPPGEPGPEPVPAPAPVAEPEPAEPEAVATEPEPAEPVAAEPAPIAEAEEAGDAEPAPVAPPEQPDADAPVVETDAEVAEAQLEPIEPIVPEPEPVPEDVWWANKDDKKSDG